MPPSSVAAVPVAIKQPSKSLAPTKTNSLAPHDDHRARLALNTSATPQPSTLPARTPTAVPPSKAIFGVHTSRKVIALTFDDGPQPIYTPQVLAVLKEWNVPATFFMIGSMVRAYPETARLVKQAGFEVGNHSWSHPSKTKHAEREVERTDDMLREVLQVDSALFRPPYGILDNGLAHAAEARGESVIIWNCLGADWDHKATAKSIAAKVLSRAKPGGIALLHDGGGDRSQTVKALPLIIEALQEQGYEFVTVSDLLQNGPPVLRLAHKPKRAPAKRHKLVRHRKKTVKARKIPPHKAPAKPASVVGTA